jgi:hypothetical protein
MPGAPDPEYVAACRALLKALDVLRLLRASETHELAGTFRRLLADDRAGGVTSEALVYVRALFAEPDATGLGLVGEAVAGPDDPAIVEASLRALTNDLLTAIR